MRFASDTGGTFTDLVLEDDEGQLSIFKAPTEVTDPVEGVLNALQIAADSLGEPRETMLARAETFIHGTTHALNALITGNTARTALLTTAGHRDILTLREGGRSDAFDHGIAYPQPFIPRALTFEIEERINAQGEVLCSLNRDQAENVLLSLQGEEVESIAVCLLWSVMNSDHEIKLGELIEAILPGVPYTLSSQLNPVLREYRRASSAAIDAALKPMMCHYLGSLEKRLCKAGFAGRLLLISSQGGLLDAPETAAAPIHVLNSGPSMAPVAGRAVCPDEDVLIADTGGTTYDLSVVRGGRIPLTQDLWIGRPYSGHMSGFPSVDVKSVGSGGGSVARVDTGGLLRVGPLSQGSNPGPACYGLGGNEATLTDACVVLGYLDPDYFLGGTMPLDPALARTAISDRVAKPLGLSVEDAAWAVYEVATEDMCQAIIDYSTNQGIDIERTVLLGGGGAAGLNIVTVAQRLNCKRVIIPEIGATLSAAGALLAQVSREFRSAFPMSSADFDYGKANSILRDLQRQCWEFVSRNDTQGGGTSISILVEARYENQAWDITVPIPLNSFSGPEDLVTLVKLFHVEHEKYFNYSDPDSHIGVTNWVARIECGTRIDEIGSVKSHERARRDAGSRECIHAGGIKILTAVYAWHGLATGVEFDGPAIVESPFTSVVIGADKSFTITDQGNLEVN
jgi:N-methylhydantoinase A